MEYQRAKQPYERWSLLHLDVASEQKTALNRTEQLTSREDIADHDVVNPFGVEFGRGVNGLEDGGEHLRATYP